MPEASQNDLKEKQEEIKENFELTIEETTPSIIQNVKIDYNINMPAGTKIDNDIVINFPPESIDKTNYVLSALPNIKLANSEQARTWAEVLKEGLEHCTYNNAFSESLKNKEGEFNNRVEYNNLNLTPKPPKFDNLEHSIIKGENAVLRITSQLGLGTLFQTPLWHSGFWVTFKAPNESSLIELHRLIKADKIKLGRHTFGLIFSNVTAYTIDKLIDFAISHIYSTTIRAEDLVTKNIKDLISAQDIPSFIWGLVCSMYPKGYRYSRACINNPEKCNHVMNDIIDPSKLNFTNFAILSDWQKAHMSNRQSKMKDINAISKYKDELLLMKDKKIYLTEDESISVIIKTPSITEYIESSHLWIDNIAELVNKTLETNDNDNERNALITKRGQATSMRQYAHWVKEIEVNTNTINDIETINSALDVLSTDDDIRNKFIESVLKYIDESTISVIGIPSFDCPKCGASQDNNIIPNVKNIIPIDVVTVFFDLLTQKLNKIASR